MAKRKIDVICWNVNGIRSVGKKGFLTWLYQEDPDIVCVQETKAWPEDIPSELEKPKNHYSYWSIPERKGYSGVAIYTKQAPQQVSTNIGIESFDIEGRVLVTCYPEYKLLNVYFPNGKSSDDRLQYKMDFYDAFLSFVRPLKEKGERLIICGDFNTAHKEIDLARPNENKDISGFLPMERAWMDKFISHGFIDSFRLFNNEPNQYTWWSMRTRARERNVGWRIDYIFISENLRDYLEDAWILPNVQGSDHCPLGIRLLI